jgi:hypothetical protein
MGWERVRGGLTEGVRGRGVLTESGLGGGGSRLGDGSRKEYGGGEDSRKQLASVVGSWVYWSLHCPAEHFTSFSTVMEHWLQPSWHPGIICHRHLPPQHARYCIIVTMKYIL